MSENEWRQLVTRALSGDMTAFDELYRLTERAVYFTCLKLLANEHDAKDVTQDAFMTALEKLGTLEDGAKFPQWVNVIAVNKCKQHFKKYNDESLDEHIEQGEEFSDDSFIPDDYANNIDKRRIIMNIIDTQLTDVQRQTIILYYYNGMKVHEIAGIMDCPEGTVTYRLKAARDKIKEAVLIYEKEHNDRLHAIVPIPILTKILRIEAENITVPDIQLKYDKNASRSSANSANKANLGGSTMKSTLTGKIIAGVAAVAVIGGGITAVVVHNNNNNDNNPMVADTSSNLLYEDNEFSQEDSDIGSDNEQQTKAVESETRVISEDITVDDEVTFGAYLLEYGAGIEPRDIDWVVLDTDGEKALIISKYILDCIPYNDEKEKVTWETCSLRQWMNDDFFNTAFNDNEKSKIIDTTLVNDDNALYGTDGGNDTVDKVFCLSVGEIKQYFQFNSWYDDDGRDAGQYGYSQELITDVTHYATYNGVYTHTITEDDYENQYKSENYSRDVIGKQYGVWWLRSPGQTSYWACDVGNYAGDYAGDRTESISIGVRGSAKKSL